MKPKDITQKMLERYNDVFADILNVLLFEGIEVVDERSLKEKTHFRYHIKNIK